MSTTTKFNIGNIETTKKVVVNMINKYNKAYNIADVHMLARQFVEEEFKIIPNKKTGVALHKEVDPKVKWSEMSGEEKQPWLEKAKNLLEDQRRAVATLAGMKYDIKKKDPTPYQLFGMQRRAELKEQGVSMSAPDMMKLISSEWNAKSDEEKNKATALTPPKKPSKAYTFFTKEQREIKKVKFPNMSGIEITRLLSAEWKAMDAEQKVPYTDLEADDKARYEDEIASHGGAPPARPPTIYKLFTNAMKEEWKGKYKPKEMQVYIKKEWESMTELDREPFEKEAEALKAQYLEELEEYMETNVSVVKAKKLPSVLKPKKAATAVPTAPPKRKISLSIDIDDDDEEEKTVITWDELEKNVMEGKIKTKEASKLLYDHLSPDEVRTKLMIATDYKYIEAIGKLLNEGDLNDVFCSRVSETKDRHLVKALLDAGATDIENAIEEAEDAKVKNYLERVLAANQ